MPANYAKTIVCLSNSRKPRGRCVAGREILENGYGEWIRPVSARPLAEVNFAERRYENNTDPKILDVVRVPMIAPSPKIHQSENHMLDDQYRWVKEGQLGWPDMDSLVETPKTLWTNEGSTSYGINDAISATSGALMSNSLFLIKPLSLRIVVQVEGGMFGPAKKRVRADFKYNGVGYRLALTDPQPERAFLARGEGDFEIGEVYMCISLTEPFSGDDRCHKLAATVIAKTPFK